MPTGQHHKAKTHCPQGHEYNDENTYRNPRTGYRACRACQREHMRDGKGRSRQLKAKYGITQEDYERISEEQGHVCKLCGSSPLGKRKYLDVDHCHDTGKVRGLLCHSCNSGLHTIDKVGLEAVAGYLEGPDLRE